MSVPASLSRLSLQLFEQLSSNLTDAKPEHVQLMSLESIHAQAGKLRVWCGNLGALQTGYSSLDYRLRESTVMQSAVSTLLQQLSNTLHESKLDNGHHMWPPDVRTNSALMLYPGSAVISGKRLPFEDQPKPADLSEESTDEDSDSDFGPRSRKELAMRLSNITDCLNSLYRLSYKIRDPTLGPTTTKAILYKEVDPETNIEVFDKLHELDMMHTHELLLLLRQGRQPPNGFEDFIAPRLATSITLRRRCFKYWQKHSRKLSGPAEIGEVIPAQPDLDLSNMQLGPGPRNADGGLAERLSPSPIARAAATILSKTDATPYDAMRDDRTERETVISFASTALDADGKGIDLPGPPTDAKRGLGFTCPYCHVLCPAKQGRGKVWRQHVLYDLQPYVCTYQGCPRPNELYRTRNQWVRHEDLAHRQCWRCFEHPDHVYTSESGLRSHWATDHAGTMTEEQIEDMVDVFSSTLIDDREHCPICFLKQPFANGMANHLANHLERAALFALPRNHPDPDGSEDGSLDSHGKRAVDRSSRDTEGTLSLFEGTVAHKSGSDSEGNAAEASARMEGRLGGGNSTASHDGVPDDENPPSVGLADALLEPTDHIDEDGRFPLLVDTLR